MLCVNFYWGTTVTDKKLCKLSVLCLHLIFSDFSPIVQVVLAASVVTKPGKG